MAVAEQPVRRILVATDFSAGADAALGIAGRYARALSAQLDLLHISAAAGTDVARPLADVAATIGGDVPVRFIGKTGDPAEQILRYADAESIDLIVVGTHGRTGVSRVLLGSVAERVIRGAACPVLVVPTSHLRASLAMSVSSSVDADDDVNGSPASRCLVCAAPSRDLVCEPCRARIRGEAIEHKHHEEDKEREERVGRR